MVSNQTEIENEILALIYSQYAEQKSSFMMMKSYRGLIFRQEIRTVAVNDHYAVFQASERNCCAALEGCVFLYSSFLPKPVKARVRDLFVHKGMLSLSNFEYVLSNWKERCHERVQPKEPTYFSLYHRKGLVRASLLNISLCGMGVLICSSEDCEFEPNSSVCVDFQITPAFRWIKLGGAIHYQQKKLPTTISRLGIRLYPKIEQAQLLKKYLAYRKAEILNEIEQNYIAATSSSLWGHS